MANNRGVKLSNEYARTLGSFYADTPKAVFAALAFSLAMRCSEDDPQRANALLRDEWNVLHQGGVVPQKPHQTEGK